jgi:formylglycine-generating enzyme required for sulfatase activity
MKGTDNRWQQVRVLENDWPVIPKPMLALSHEFVFDTKLVQLPETFSVMRYEVSCQELLNSQTLSVIRQQNVSGLCEFALDEAVTGVTYDEASGFCQSLGARLPSEAQWVFMASLVKKSGLIALNIIVDLDRKEQGDIELAEYKEDARDAQRGPLGIRGLYGNVWEITRTKWHSQKNQYIIKGGAFDLVNKSWLMHPYYRAAFNGDDILNQNIGFRCVK